MELDYTHIPKRRTETTGLRSKDGLGECNYRNLESKRRWPL